METRQLTVGLLCASPLKFGGVETHLRTLIAGLRDQVRFMVVAPLAPEFAHTISSLGATVRDWRPRGRLDWRAARDLHRIFIDEPVDLIHVQDPRGGIVGRLVARWLRIPVVYTIHVAPYDYIVGLQGVSPFKVWLYRHVEAFFNHRLTARLIYVSRNAWRGALASGLAPPERAIAIENGIDGNHPSPGLDVENLRLAMGTPPGVPLICFAGRIAWQKGLDVLVSALQVLRTDTAPFHVWLVGDGPMRPELEASVREAGLEKYVQFVGYRTDVTDVIGASDVFVLPSRYEGMPFALLEAMAAGLPCVVTNVGDSGLLVAHGVTGLVVEPGDPKVLAEALRTVIDSPALRARMAAEGRARVREFSADMMIARVRAVYADVINSAAIHLRPAQAGARLPRRSRQAGPGSLL